jgi:hypothetical protein
MELAIGEVKFKLKSCGGMHPCSSSRTPQRDNGNEREKAGGRRIGRNDLAIVQVKPSIDCLGRVFLARSDSAGKSWLLSLP